jgi:AcrR family transcriptional regulator
MTAPESRTLHEHAFLRREPRQARSADRLERLLAATTELLAAEGYPAVTVANLKAITGMPHSTIYDVVADPRDLVAVLVVRTLDEMHEALVAYAATIRDEDEAVEFVRTVTLVFIGQYRTNDILRAALSGLDADPLYRWINIADSERNARVIARVLEPYADDPHPIVYERCLLMAHLTTAAATLAVDLGGDEGDGIVSAFEYVVERSLNR